MKYDKKNRVVIVGEFSPPILACIRSWAKQSFDVGLICTGSEKQFICKSRYLKRYTFLPPKYWYTEKGIEIINKFVNEFSAIGLSVMNETMACWVNGNVKGLPTGLKFLNSTTESLKRLESKEAQIEIAKRVGFDILPTYYINTTEKSISGIPDSDFPLCLRPSVPGKVKPTFKVQYIHKSDILKRYLRKLNVSRGGVIAQPFKALPNIVVHGYRNVNGETSGLKGFIVERKFEGLTLVIREHLVDLILKKKIKHFIEYFDIVGCYHFEFLYDEKNEKSYFLELNCRIGGTTAKTYALGYDEPANLLRAFELHASKIPHKIEKKVASNRQFLVKYLVAVFRNNLSPIDYPVESKSKRLLFFIDAFLKSKDDVWDISDILGSLTLYWGNLRRRLLFRNFRL
jgi:hypothetical protein